MNTQSIARDLEEAIATLPLLDPHTHLIGGRLAARGLHDILLYHMVVSDLYAAGCPGGARMTQYPGFPSDEEATRRIEEAIPYLPHIATTSMWWGVRIILADLYDFREPITRDSWRRLDSTIRERADDRAWQREIFRRLNLRRACTEIARRGAGRDDDILQYSLEWAFFTRCQWGEYDTALYELERCWGKTPDSPVPIGGSSRPRTDRTIRSIEDVHEAMRHYVGAFPFDRLISTATHISTDIEYRSVSADEMARALGRRATAGPAERAVYASYINEVFLTEIEKHADRIVFQFSFGAEPLPHETASRLSQRTIGEVADMIARHPRLRFHCYLSSRHANQSMCTLARELPNLTLVGVWWHNFFPDVARQVLRERLDMLPTNKHIGFFSDAYTIEWTYGKAVLVRKVLAEVLAERVAEGRLSRDEALDAARRLVHDTPRDLLGMVSVLAFAHSCRRIE